MKKLVLFVVFLLVSSCISKVEGNHPDADSKRSAVYLIHGQAELSAQDLRAHPEVVVVQTFNDFKQYASQKTALWIDKSATPLNSEQEKWINEAPQAYYPIVLVGSSDTLHSFRDLLRLCCFMGPAGEYPGFDAPGFSVIQREETHEPDAPAVNFLQGFDQKPTAQSILEITSALLEGTFTPAATATRP